MRKMDEAKLIHKDHVNAVLSIDFAPHGKEFPIARVRSAIIERLKELGF